MMGWVIPLDASDDRDSIDIALHSLQTVCSAHCSARCTAWDAILGWTRTLSEPARNKIKNSSRAPSEVSKVRT